MVENNARGLKSYLVYDEMNVAIKILSRKNADLWLFGTVPQR